MISDYPIVKKIAWTSGTRRTGASMDTHREYVGYLDEWDETERLTDEEIVRCRDCKRFSLDNSDHDYRSGWWCHRWNTDMVKPDGFCAWGERRDDA